MKKDFANVTPAGKKTSVRWFIVFMLFLVTSINYADRATLSITGDSVQHDLGLDSVAMGYVFSAFGWRMSSDSFRAAGCWTVLVQRLSLR